MISNGPARTFTRNAVEAWLFRLSECDWEKFINKDHLKIGRSFYRQASQVLAAPVPLEELIRIWKFAARWGNII